MNEVGLFGRLARLPMCVDFFEAVGRSAVGLVAFKTIDRQPRSILLTGFWRTLRDAFEKRFTKGGTAISRQCQCLRE